MNILCNRQNLVRGMTLLSHIVQSKTINRPVLSNVRFAVVENDQLELTGSDLEMGMRYRVPLVQCYEGGSALIPAAQFAGILRETPDENLKIELDGRLALVRGKGVEFKLPVFSEEGFPEVPDLPGDAVELNKATLDRIIREVSFAMNKEKNRFGLDSMLLCLHADRLEGVATDQVRLAFSHHPLGRAVEKDENVVFPAKSIPVLRAILEDDQDEKITMLKGANQVTFRFRSGAFITRLMATSFPRYRDAFANYADVPEILLRTEEFNTAIRQILLMTCDSARNIALILEKDRMTLKASTPLGEAKKELAIDYSGESLNVGMNPYFVQDFLKEVSAQKLETLRMKAGGPKRPIILYTQGDYLYFMSPTAM